MKKIYDGSQFCGNSDCCPVAELDHENQTVTLHDPAKPENGRFRMTVEEYNTLLKNAPRA
jgi:hypothetical protein